MRKKEEKIPEKSIKEQYGGRLINCENEAELKGKADDNEKSLIFCFLYFYFIFQIKFLNHHSFDLYLF